MAGLCAAARARELGLDAVVHEKGTRPGGSMLLSSCVVWRYRTLEDFRNECPGGDPRVQQLIIERFDDALTAFQRHAMIERMLLDAGWQLDGFESEKVTLH